MGVEEENIAEVLFKTSNDLLTGTVEKGIPTGFSDID